MKPTWLDTNTFHYADFRDIGRLVEEKQRRGLTLSLCLPTLNEEKTIGKEVIIMRSELMTRFPLLDEIVVIDSGSEDRTREIAAAFGAEVHLSAEILPRLKSYRGKGENLWKALYIARGDIIVYIDADIKNIHHRFVYGLLGPLLMSDTIRFTKAFYDRPIATGRNRLRPTGGGRVTELVIRPMFSLFFPELTQILQPLSGEYAGFRDIFDKIPFPIGYGIETSMILDIRERWGMEVMAQVDLEKRVHRNQDTKALGKMSFVILKTFLNRIQRLGIVELKKALHEEMLQYQLDGNELRADPFRVKGIERPPMVDVPEYRRRFGLAPSAEKDVQTKPQPEDRAPCPAPLNSPPV
jgi:glucosyl-3-phosphoglycerate synthase